MLCFADGAFAIGLAQVVGMAVCPFAVGAFMISIRDILHIIMHIILAYIYMSAGIAGFIRDRGMGTPVAAGFADA